MMIKMLIFFSILATISLLLFVYIGRRLISTSSLSRRARRLAWAGLGTLIALQFMAFNVNRLWPDPDKPTLIKVFPYVGYVAMGFLVLTVLLLLAQDVARLTVHLIHRLHHRFQRKTDGQNPPPANPSRRLFLSNGASLGVLGASGMMTTIGFTEARRRPFVEAVQIPIANLPPSLEGFSIVQFTDLHVGPTIKRSFVEEVVRDINALKPDLIAFTGDLIDGFVPDLRPYLEPLSELKARHGSFFSTGNHEYYWDVESWVAEAERLGFVVLNNRHRIIEHNGARLLVGGVTDYNGGSFSDAHRSDPQKAMAGAPPADLRLLLAHQPRSCFAAAQAGFDLQLSGHTHGGQFIPWNLLVRLQQPYVSGLHRHDKLWVYTSRGTGYWGPPLRLGIPSEITRLTLTRAKATPNV